MTDIPKQYEPQDAQARWYPFWEEHGYFHADPQSDKPPHTIMIPLPNVTGALHMGHALNGTLQDLITRWRRMQGYEALWMPGTDHAGIATQAVVERRMLEEEGLTRHDIGREALVNRIWKWKDAYEGRILDQLKQLGATCDWRRTRFTLDEVCSRAVRRTFFKFFGDGLIYRGKRLVNWDTYLQTAVANDEVFHEDIDGHFWTFNYPVVGENGEPTGETISFSTTRPETMLGDTAVCVHPSDERYQHLVGKTVRLPLDGRKIPIIADALLADPEMGTGAVKVTPAHDPNDYACGQRNKLEMINILNADGTLNENGGRWAGQDRYAAREAVVEAMSDAGHYEGVEDRVIPIMHSDRSKTPIEPLLSDQWFVKMDDLAQSAIDAVNDNRVTFFPARYERSYLDWLGEKRDWCISRQLWWGHRIPIWSKDCRDRDTAKVLKRRVTSKSWFDSSCVQIQIQDGGTPKVQKFTDTDSHTAVPQTFVLVCVDHGHPEIEQQLEAAGFEQDPDVLDTWFSSALWPHATLGWPDTEHNPPLADGRSVDDRSQDASTVSTPSSTSSEEDGGGRNEVLDYFYPGMVLITSRDIITLWVARMVLTGLYNMKDVPFQHVCIHPKILDGFGQTMSKSKGNGVNPIDLIDKYGTDAVRFTIASLAGETQDVRLPVGYECPHCQTVIPQTLDHQKAVPGGGEKPRVSCPKCKNSSQYSSPWFEPDPEQPVARVVSERFEYGRNFCNKLWNASRFALLNLEDYAPDETATDDQTWDLTLDDRWILSRLLRTRNELTRLLERYQFDAATRTIRDFTWNEFCDWYLEMLKPRLRDETSRPAAQRMLVGVLDALLKLLQPFIPFLCEELWQRLNEVAPRRGLFELVDAAESVMIAPWPDVASADWQDAELEQRFERFQETIVAVRNVRAVYRIAPSVPLTLHLRCDAGVAAEMQDLAGSIHHLVRTKLEAAGPDVERPGSSAAFALPQADGFIPLEGIIDREAELARQQAEAEKLEKFIAGNEKKLANENFVRNAPEEVVRGVRDTLTELQDQLCSVKQIIADLG